jgi:Flp pilus assembly pilin Flp
VGNFNFTGDVQKMRTKFTALYLRFRDRIGQEQGQDLLEYCFVVAIIALAVAAGMQSVATDVNQVFMNIGSLISTHTQ